MWIQKALKNLLTHKHLKSLSTVEFHLILMSFYLFDKVLVLKADAKALNARLTTREGEDNIGNNHLE